MGLRIAIVTDDRVFSDALGRVLRDQPGFEPEACDVSGGQQPLHGVAVALLDGRMAHALARCEALCAGGGPAVILVGAPDDDEWACLALAAGALGILTRHAHVTDVVSAIRVVHADGLWVQRRCLRKWIQLTRPAFAAPAGAILDGLLSRREREVFHGAAAGAANKELAHRLAISEATVKSHLTRIFQKLGVSSRAELAAAFHGLNRSDASRRISRTS